MPTTTRTAPPPADLDTLNSPRIRFNWGFHAATDDVVRGRAAKDMSDHFDRSYAAGYLAGQLHMASATERPDSSESAWLVHIEPVTDVQLREVLVSGSPLQLAVLKFRLECSSDATPRVAVSDATRRAAQARINREWRSVGRKASDAACRNASRATCQLMDLATGETW